MDDRDLELIYYTTITSKDYNNGIFDGGHMGYASKEIVKFFENK